SINSIFLSYWCKSGFIFVWDKKEPHQFLTLVGLYRGGFLYFMWYAPCALMGFPRLTCLV
ncbi:hypothetical protein, partial [Hallella sp.]|uniref:hypothetical protein n=1 Tax=Hallella sp. TaxID=2980186 RepID=UPI002848AE09